MTVYMYTLIVLCIVTAKRDMKHLLLNIMTKFLVSLTLQFTVDATICLASCETHEENCPVLIRRRISLDIAVLNNGDSTSYACPINGSYIVMERKCTTNAILLDRCKSFALTPSGEPSERRLAVKIDKEEGAKVFNSSAQLRDVGVATSNGEYVSSSYCHIVSLEVYRGDKHAIKISHSGFFLTLHGTLQIDGDEFAYDFEEYEGELYRMNLSCSSKGLPKNGCLFFKVIGQANITEPKFNCSVPGTLFNKSTTSSQGNYDNSSSGGAGELDNSGPNLFDIGSPLTSTLMGVGGVLIISTVLVFAACALVCIKISEHRKRAKELEKISEMDKAEIEQEDEKKDAETQSVEYATPHTLHKEVITPTNTEYLQLRNDYATPRIRNEVHSGHVGGCTDQEQTSAHYQKPRAATVGSSGVHVDTGKVASQQNHTYCEQEPVYEEPVRRHTAIITTRNHSYNTSTKPSRFNLQQEDSTEYY